jgi:hypothetical protein
MSIATLAISGLRGFGSDQTLSLAIPNGKVGSGLTVLVGPNNGGKSTVIEAFKALSCRQAPTFAIGRRNQRTNGKISVKAATDNGVSFGFRTIERGGSGTVWEMPEGFNIPNIFVVPSRRFFPPTFQEQSTTREGYTENYPLPTVRGTVIERFPARLFEIQQRRNKFDDVSREVPRFRTGQ